MKPPRLLGLVLITATSACSDLAAPARDTNAPMQTDEIRYDLTREVRVLPFGSVVRLNGEIAYEFRNLAQRTMYVVKCHEINFLLQRLDDDGTWRRKWGGPDRTRCLGPPTVIESGGRLDGVLPISSYEPNDRGLEAAFGADDLPGIYRLVLWNVVFEFSLEGLQIGDEVPTEFLYSNQFVLDNAN